MQNPYGSSNYNQPQMQFINSFTNPHQSTVNSNTNPINAQVLQSQHTTSAINNHMMGFTQQQQSLKYTSSQTTTSITTQATLSSNSTTPTGQQLTQLDYFKEEFNMTTKNETLPLTKKEPFEYQDTKTMVNTVGPSSLPLLLPSLLGLNDLFLIFVLICL
jgi:hypothetical protein